MFQFRVCVTIFCLTVIVGEIFGQTEESNEETVENQTVKDNEPENETTTSQTNNDDLFWTPSVMNDTILDAAEMDVADPTDDGPIKVIESSEIITTTQLAISTTDTTSKLSTSNTIFDLGNNPYETSNATQSKPETDKDHFNEIAQETTNSEDNIHVAQSNHSEMDEKIVLPRNNCNMEMTVDDNHDLRIQIKFEPVSHLKAGKCCIGLRGRENAFLALQISDVHLQNGQGEEETLKAVVTTSGIDFTLKQYYENEEYCPLLLTESHTIFIILQYNFTVVKPSRVYTHFNVEAFRYGTKEHAVFHQVQSDSHSHNSPYKSSAHPDAEKIYFTTENPPNYYYSQFSFN